MQQAAFANNAEWLKGIGNACDVVMSSRVRLARNIAGFPFTPQASRIDRAQILEACKSRILNMNTQSSTRFLWMDLHKVQREDRDLLVERQLMSRQHARGKLSDGQGGLDEPRGVAILVPDERVSIMINEEDHIRLQAMKSGLALNACLNEANEFDDLIEDGIDYAYHPRFGYLTACPTNVGTGLRLSVMMHLPGLKMTGEIEKVRRAARDMGLAVRGFYGEGSESPGEFYQVSNQTTLGKSDDMILREMEQDIIPKIVGYERTARQSLLKNRREVVEDQIWRALGTLRYARSMKTDEAMELLSLVRFGVMCDMIQDLSIETIHTLLLSTQPMHLQRTLGQALTQQQRRQARAELIRRKLSPVESTTQGDRELNQDEH